MYFSGFDPNQRTKKKPTAPGATSAHEAWRLAAKAGAARTPPGSQQFENRRGFGFQSRTAANYLNPVSFAGDISRPGGFQSRTGQRYFKPPTPVVPGTTSAHERFRLQQAQSPVGLTRRPEAAAAGGVPNAGAETRPGMAMREPPYRPGQTGSRYLDMYYSGTPKARGQAVSKQNLIHMIRGTNQTWGNPKISGTAGGVQEFNTPLEAAYGMKKEDAMARYGIEAPISGELQKTRIAASAPPEVKLERVIGPGGTEGVFHSGNQRYYFPENQQYEQEYNDAWQTAQRMREMDDEEFSREIAKRKGRARQILIDIINQGAAGGR